MKFLKIILIISSLLFLSVSSTLAASPLPEVSYQAEAIIQLNLKARPRTEIVKRIVGNLDGKNNDIADVDGDGLPDIETEIVSMNLVGSDPIFGEISLKLKNGLQDKKNTRTAEQPARCLRPARRAMAPCPVDSFFDIFVELRHTPFHNSAVGLEEPAEVLTSCESVQLRGASKGLTDLSGHYTQRISGKIALCNRNREPAGSLLIHYLKLHRN